MKALAIFLSSAEGDTNLAIHCHTRASVASRPGIPSYPIGFVPRVEENAGFIPFLLVAVVNIFTPPFPCFFIFVLQTDLHNLVIPAPIVI
jgi:hypothetical protein